MPSLNSLLVNCRQLIFPRPRSCLICGEKHKISGKYICEKCYDSIKRVYPPVCNNCGRPLQSTINCLHCRNRKYEFSKVYSFGIYDKKLRELIHLFKYKKYSGIGYEITKIMINEMDFVNSINNTILVPVPLHSNKVKARGYNQSQVLCEAFKKHAQLKWFNVLDRVIDTKPLSTYKLDQRQQAIKGQFAVKSKWSKSVKNKNVLLVDDVITTGSTLNECAKVLKGFGVAKVSALTIATTLLK